MHCLLLDHGIPFDTYSVLYPAGLGLAGGFAFIYVLFLFAGVLDPLFLWMGEDAFLTNAKNRSSRRTQRKGAIS